MDKQMDKRTLGANGPAVSAIGLGCMGMSDFYGPADRKQCMETVHHALSIGMTFFNTGDFYGMGHNEMLLGEALSGGRREKAFISVKYGGMRDPSGAWMGFDLKPNSTKNFLAYTLKRLNTDYIDLYQPCRVSMDIPIEETVGAIADLIKAGYVRYLGLSEANTDTIKRAHKVHPVTALEVEYSIFDRHIEKEMPVLNELGIGLVAYGVLSRGLITDVPQNSYGGNDFRSMLPRFQKENFEQNCRLIDVIRKIADAKNVSVTQLATAWVSTRGTHIIPLIGTTKSERLTKAAEALAIKFTDEELAALDDLHKSVAGTRYPEAHMALVTR